VELADWQKWWKQQGEQGLSALLLRDWNPIGFDAAARVVCLDGGGPFSRLRPCPIANLSRGHSGAVGPFRWIDGSPIGVWTLGGDRFAVTAPGHEQTVTGLEEAQQAAHALAERLR
jgi:hypothetical protein